MEQFFERTLDLTLYGNFQGILRLLGVVRHADIHTGSPHVHGLHPGLRLHQINLDLLALFELVRLLNFFELVLFGSLRI